MVNVSLNSIIGDESFGGLTSSYVIKQVRVSPPEFSFSSSFSSDFAIGRGFVLDKVKRSIINGSVLSLEAFGSFIFPKVFILYGIASRERLGGHYLDYLYLYPVNSELYTIEEAKNNRLEKVAIKNVIIQNVTSTGSMIYSSNQSGSPYKNWRGTLYSILYEDTLQRLWEEKELTREPQSFFNLYAQSQEKPKQKKVVSVNSLGKRKRNVDWSKSRLFSRRMAEKGVLHRIKIKKASVRKGNVLVYFDEKNNTWEESELVFETMASMLIEKFNEQQKKK